MWKSIKWFASALGLGGLASEILKGWLKNSTLIDSPNSFIAGISAAVIWLTGTAWFYPVLIATLATAIILWLIYIYSRWTYYRALALEQIGDDMLRCARTIANRQAGFRSRWPDNISDLRGNIAALCASIRWWWIWAPSESDIDRPTSCEEIFRYFDFVGSYLSKGNRKEAKARALLTKENSFKNALKCPTRVHLFKLSPFPLWLRYGTSHSKRHLGIFLHFGAAFR